MRFTKKTESSSELADELTSLLAQGVERLVLLERDTDETERVANEWRVDRAFPTQAIARTVQKVVEREAPFGRLFMLCGYRAETEVDRVMLDVASTRAEVVLSGTAASGSALAAASDSSIGDRMFAHVMQMNERLMLQLNAGAAMTVTQYTQIIETFRARQKELEDDNAQLRAELRARREKDNEREDRGLKEKNSHERGMRMLDTLSQLAPVIIQQVVTNRGGTPTPALQDAAVEQFVKSLSAEQLQQLSTVLTDAQRSAFASIQKHPTQVAAAAFLNSLSEEQIVRLVGFLTDVQSASFATIYKPTRAAAAPASNAAHASPSPPPQDAPSGVLSEEAFRALVTAPSPERAMRLFKFLEAIDPEALTDVLPMKLWLTLTSFYDPKVIARPDYVDSFVAWVASFDDEQRARFGKLLSPEQQQLLSQVLIAGPASSDTKATPTSGVAGAS